MDEELAARIYNRYTLQSMGLRARKNFDYRLKDLRQIISDIEDFQTQRIPIEILISTGGNSQIIDSTLKDLHQVEYKSSIISNSNKYQGQQ